MEDIKECEFGSPLPITHVMWYFDTHLQHRKRHDFTPLFAFMDHVPDMECKILSMEPDCYTDTRMYLLRASTDRARDWHDQVQKKLNYVLKHSARLQKCGVWDPQANWTNCRSALRVMDDKYGHAGCNVKGEEPADKGHVEPAQTPAAKRKLTGQAHALEKKKTAAKPAAAEATTGSDSDGSHEEEDN